MKHENRTNAGQDPNKKQEQLDTFKHESNEESKLTTNQGVRVADDEHSLKAGARGPTLMEDFHFREKMTHFDHERIPERAVHARGFGAHGIFEVYESMKPYTKAHFLQDPSIKTPVFVRFSTVVGSRGSADTVRDVRGFATKFYTEEGNYDLVGNNMPVFFIQDAMKFPDLVHAIKPEPHNEIPQATAAHDTFWDFVSANTETAHKVMWALSDRALPRSYRMMEGFGVHTFRFINEEGDAHLVKFHWKPKLGVHSLVWDETQKLAGKDPDYNRRDLWDAIEAGHFAEFEFGVQLIKEGEEHGFDFDVLDATKLWPEEQVPVKIIGKMTLNRNTDNFFAETEQVAFHPGHVVPGIDFTNDPLLQGRLFSYTDTQLTRLGGPNFAEIPINRPVSPVHNNQRDGMHRMTINKGNVSYHKNRLAGNSPEPAPSDPSGHGGYEHYTEKVEGRKVRESSASFDDHYSQATMFWNSMSDVEKQHIVSAFQFELGKVKDKEIRQRVVDMFANVDGLLARKIAEGIGAKIPENSRPSEVGFTSPAISMMNTVKSTLTRKVAVLAGNGYDDEELESLMSAFRDAGMTAEIVSKTLGDITGAAGGEREVTYTFDTASSVMFDAIYVASGRRSLDELIGVPEAFNFVKEGYQHFKTIGAIGEGNELLAAAGAGSPSSGGDVSGSGMAVMSGVGLITAQQPSDLKRFAQSFIDAVAQHRHWSRSL